MFLKTHARSALARVRRQNHQIQQFGSSDVTLANGCCEYDLLDDRIIFNGGKRKLTADRKLKKQARKPHK